MINFGSDKKRKDNLNPYCKECKKEKSAKTRNEHRVKLREKGRQRYYKNKDKLLSQSNKYHYRKNCEKYGGEKEYLKLKNKFKNKLNEGLTFKVLKFLFPDTYIQHNKFRIYTPTLTNRNFIKPDFHLEVNNKKLIIEYNGQQHYEIDKHFFGENAENRYTDQLIRDNFLRNYCKENSIILIEIDGRQYTGFKNILNYLKEEFFKINLV